MWISWIYIDMNEMNESWVGKCATAFFRMHSLCSLIP